jgi:DNA-binding NarL/FixJ family response regulator
MTSDPLAAPEAGGAITVLGTGIMGSAMARNLAAAGLRTTAWDRLPQATAPLAAASAVVAGSARDAISDARAVITMLPNRTRVVLADDDVLLREGLASMLDRSGLEVVGQASDAAGLLELIGRLRPKLALVDIRMPPKYSTEGLEAARVIQRDYPLTAVVVLSAHVEVEHAMDLLATGHRTGYLLKSRVADVTEFIDTLRRVERGGSAVDPALVQELVAARRADDPLAVLTGREREVLALMAEGRSNAGIGQVLWVTERTVEKHVRSIMMKLRLPGTGEVHRRVLAVLAFLEAL